MFIFQKHAYGLINVEVNIKKEERYHEEKYSIRSVTYIANVGCDKRNSLRPNNSSPNRNPKQPNGLGDFQ